MLHVELLAWAPRLKEQALAANIPDPINVPMDRLFVLTAARRFNEGAECVGTDYKDRELNLVPVDRETQQDNTNSQGRADNEGDPEKNELHHVHV